ncbi:MAG: hypothetical protein U0792_14060 [Gemmataceae bacterium]
MYRNGSHLLELKWANEQLTPVEAKRGGVVSPLGGNRIPGPKAATGFETITGLDGKTGYLFRNGRAAQETMTSGAT